MLKKDSTGEVQYRVPPVLWIVLGALLTLVVVMVQKNMNGGKGILGVSATPTVAVAQPTQTSFRQIDLKKDLGTLAPLGNKNAKVKLVLFSDFECPFCGALVGKNPQVMDSLKTNIPGWEPAFPKIKADYIDTGKAVLYFRDFPAHQDSNVEHNAARCANDQGKFWEMHDALFALQDEGGVGSDAKAKMTELAANIGLDEQKFADCFSASKFQKDIDADMAASRTLGVQGTPHMFINSQYVSGADTYSSFKKIIDAELAK